MILLNLVLAGLLVCCPVLAEDVPEEAAPAPVSVEDARVEPASRGGLRAPLEAPEESPGTIGASNFLYVPPPTPTLLGTFTTTGYSNFDPSVDGRGIMATGYRTFPGAVAVDPRVIPLFSVLRIEGLPGTYVALDTGGAVRGTHIDVFYESRAAAVAASWVRRQVWILK